MTGAGWHRGFMLSADLETTGTNVETDRLVTACTALVDGAGKTPPKVAEWLAWPGVDIPAAAAKIHGVTTEHARANGLPAAQAVGEVCEAILEAARQGVPIIVYNAAFDLTMLDRESTRHEIGEFSRELAATGALIFDPLVVDKGVDRYRKGKRTLTLAAAHYGVKQDQAHNATGDAVTAARVTWMICARHPRIAQMPTAELMAWQATEKRAQAASLAKHFRDKGEHAKADTVDGWWPVRPAGATTNGYQDA
ncbi:MAG TPA: exonuclease domain-containing protein [Trebonia sp.]|jgi:DNA polymerase-3 subunit epsilon